MKKEYPPIEKQDFRSASAEVRQSTRKRAMSLIKSGKKKGTRNPNSKIDS